MSSETFPEGIDGFCPSHLRAMIRAIGDDPGRDGLRDTPARVLRSWKELYSGYSMDPRKVVTVFEDPCDEMVVLRGIEMYSTCEHHLLPFFGQAHIGYVPNGKVIGISKLARIVEVYSRRLQIQERIGEQVAQALMDILHPLGVGVIIEARHLCMMARGVGKQNSLMVTSAMRGVIRDKPEARAEFLQMCGRG